MTLLPAAFPGVTRGFRLFRYRADWVLVAAMLLLVAVGLVAVWSFSAERPGFFARQLLWAGIGLGAFFIAALLDYRMFKNHGAPLLLLYLFIVAALASLFVFAPVTRGIRAWFQVGGAGIQPVEPMKLVLALVLAKYFSRRHVEIARLRHLFVSGLYAGVPALLVLLQPDLGSALILAAIWLAVVSFSGITGRHLAIFFLLMALVAGISWTSLLAPYQKTRITSFFDPYRDPRGAGYNTIQAMVAAGSGQLLGKGIGYGTQSHLNFLPEAETDFIFAAFTEETGFIGASLLLALFGVLFWRVMRIGITAYDNFSKLFVLGFAAFLFTGVAIHVGMNLGLLPVTGIGLPFVSYGGSNLVMSLVGLGIVQSIRIHSRAEIG
ncbi:MAG: rod shape-determining protein RodA [bacterium]|nr:rod shape-determining protein RodA [bacterium]